jgi:hypothetical protein
MPCSIFRHKNNKRKGTLLASTYQGQGRNARTNIKRKAHTGCLVNETNLQEVNTLNHESFDYSLELTAVITLW